MILLIFYVVVDIILHRVRYGSRIFFHMFRDTIVFRDVQPVDNKRQVVVGDERPLS